MTTILQEPFDSFFRWINVSGFTSVAGGRTGNMAQSVGGTNQLDFTIPAPQESDTITFGFAFQVSSLAANRGLITLKSDAGVQSHVSVRANTDGSLSALRGAVATGTVLGTTATGLVAINTWVYLEAQVVLSDTVGAVTLRVNGSGALSLAAQDTKNLGTKTTFDFLSMFGVSGVTYRYDDMYVAMGAGETFQGAITVASSSLAVNARQSVRVLRSLVSVEGSGQAAMVFAGSAVGTGPALFSGAGQGDVAFAASAAGVLVFPASSTAAVAFDATATSVGVYAAAGQSDVVFGATATGATAGAVTAQADVTFGAVPAASTVIPAGTAQAIAAMTFYPVVKTIDFRPIGKATVISSDFNGPVSYQSPPWTPAAGALLGLVMVVPVMQDPIESGPGQATIFATDTFGGTSDWTIPVDYLGHSALGATRALWRVVVMYATAGPSPLPGVATVSPAVPAPAYTGRSSSYGPYFDHHAVFFELRGQARQPLGHVGLAQSGSFEVIFGEPVTYDDPPADQVTAFMGDDSPVDPFRDVGLAVAPSSLVLGLVHQALDQQAAVDDPSGSIPIDPSGPLAGGKLLAPVPAFTMSAAPGFATFLADPPAPDGWDTSHVVMAYRNGIGPPASSWLGETALVPWIDPYDAVGDTYGWKVQHRHPQQPLIALAVEFRSAVLDVAPPVVTEFGVWIQGADGAWIDRTCDIRSIEVERGRSTYSDGFAAATCALTFSNFEGIYSAWNPHSIWAAYGGKYQAGVPLQVWGYTGGVATAMFTGSTDSVVDTFPGTVDALTAVQSTDGFKGFARHSNLALPGNAFVGTGEFSGQRIHRLATDAGWTGPRAIDTGWTEMQATTMEGTSMDKMREVGESEWGWLFIDEAGVLVFRQRDALQTDPRMTEAQWVFTDSHDIVTDLPVVCYQEPLEFSVDEASIINIAQIQNATVPAGAIVAEQGTHTATDPPSRAHYGPRTWTRTLPIHDGALGVAQVVVMEYGDDDKHIQALTFNALRPGHRDTATNIRINDRIKVYRHYPGGFLLRQELLVQGVHHSIVPSGNRAHDPAQWDVTVRTATAALIFGFGHWDAPTTDADGVEHGWDVDQWGI